MTDKSIQECKFHISAYDTDMKSDCKLTSICNYLEETASIHTSNLGTSPEEFVKRGIAWVLSRLKIEMTRYPEWQEKIRVKSWPRGDIGLFLYRDFIIYDSDDNILGKATSAWLIIDIAKRRPLRPGPFLKEFELSNIDEPILSETLSGIGKYDKGETIFTKTLRYSDCDINKHANNVKYVRWMLDALPLEQMETETIKSFEINYLKETKMNDKVEISTNKIAEDTYVTTVNKGNETNCKAIIKF
jgi:acyl-ACP thioesterase